MAGDATTCGGANALCGDVMLNAALAAAESGGGPVACVETQLQIVLMNSEVLEGWVRENQEKSAKKGSVEIDDVFEPMDVLSKQMLDCTAADLAIEDVIYSLDKAVQEGSIPVDAYLKNIRSLSREQFFHRAMGAKVRAAQMQAQVVSMAARATQYAV